MVCLWLFEIVSGFEFSKESKFLLSNCVIHQQKFANFINEDNIIFLYYYIENVFAGNQWTYLRTVTFISSRHESNVNSMWIYSYIVHYCVQWFSRYFQREIILWQPLFYVSFGLGNLVINFSNICFLDQVSTAVLYYKKQQSATKFILFPGASRG